MRRFMAVGGVGAGKTTLCRRLLGLTPEEKKTQAPELLEGCLDTPGEYLEHRGFYRALSVMSVDVDFVLLLASCAQQRQMFPAGICAMLTPPAFGVVTKTDLAQSEADLIQAEALLLSAGVRRIFRVSCETGEGIEALRAALEGTDGAT